METPSISDLDAYESKAKNMKMCTECTFLETAEVLFYLNTQLTILFNMFNGVYIPPNFNNSQIERNNIFIFLNLHSRIK